MGSRWLALVLLFSALPCAAQTETPEADPRERGEPPLTAVRVEGEARARAPGGDWEPLRAGGELAPGSELDVRDAVVELRLAEPGPPAQAGQFAGPPIDGQGSTVTLAPRSKAAVDARPQVALSLEKGEAFVRGDRGITLESAGALFTASAADLHLRARGKKTEATVHAGRVDLALGGEARPLLQGTQTTVSGGTITREPKDAGRLREPEFLERLWTVTPQRVVFAEAFARWSADPADYAKADYEETNGFRHPDGYVQGQTSRFPGSGVVSEVHFGGQRPPVYAHRANQRVRVRYRVTRSTPVFFQLNPEEIDQTKHITWCTREGLWNEIDLDPSAFDEGEPLPPQATILYWTSGVNTPDTECVLHIERVLVYQAR